MHEAARPDSGHDRILSARNLRKRFVTGRSIFGRATLTFTAVDDVSFDVYRGETLAVVGESGAGKSTVGRLVLRLIEPDAGSVLLEGVDLLGLSRRQLRDARRRMQMIFQDPYSSLDPRVSVGDSVIEPMRLHLDLDARSRRQRALGLLERVGIDRRLFDRYPTELSGGQLQRIAIARALTVEPDIIVCDEPVAALDVSVRAQVLNLMLDLQEERGVAYLFISHDLALVEGLAHRVAVMRGGKIVTIAPPKTLYQSPDHDYTRELIAAIPVAAPPSMRPSASTRSST